MPVYSITFRNRWLALLLGLVVLGVGAALLVVGIALLAGVALVGGVLGLGVLAYRKLRGTRARPVRPSDSGLDPSLEVFAHPDVLPADPVAGGATTPNVEPRRLEHE